MLKIDYLKIEVVPLAGAEGMLWLGGRLIGGG